MEFNKPLFWALVVLVVLVLCAYYVFMHLYHPTEFAEMPFKHAGYFFDFSDLKVTALYAVTLAGCAALSYLSYGYFLKKDMQNKALAAASSLLEYQTPQ